VHDGFPACKFYLGGNHLIENLMDFSFQRFVRPRILKMFRSVQLRVGLAAAGRNLPRDSGDYEFAA